MEQIKLDGSISLIESTEALREDYVPEQVLYREEYIKNIIYSVFKPPLEDRGGSHMFIQGTTGTGKTLSVNYCMDVAESTVKEGTEPGLKIDENDLKIIYINCRAHPTQSAVALELVKQTISKDKKKGMPTYIYLEEFIEFIDRVYKHVIIILDEVDKILPKDKDDTLFYTLVRAREMKQLKNSYISLICIANNPRAMEKLSDGTRSSFGINVQFFPRYTKEQLIQILTDRAKKAFKEGVIEPRMIEEIAIHVSEALAGDCRKAISLLKISAELADKNKELKIVKSHLDGAKQIMEQNVLHKELLDMSLHERVIFYAIGLYYDAEQKPPKFQILFKIYIKLCELIKRTPLQARQVRNHLKSLIKTDLIDEFMEGGKLYYQPLADPKTILAVTKQFFTIYQVQAERIEEILHVTTK